MDLFADDKRPHTVVADAQGGIRWWPCVWDASQTTAWYECLRDGVPWQAEQRPMYDKVVAVPRLMASFWLHDLPAALPLQTIYEVLMQTAPAGYTAVQLNWYRDGQDSVAMHQDKRGNLVEGEPIALVSLGATRRMVVRSVVEPQAAPMRLDLHAGSLLVMSHASQSTHEHGIPKTRDAVGGRISLVFRARQRL